MCVAVDAGDARHFGASAVDPVGRPGSVGGGIRSFGDRITIGDLDGGSPEALPGALGVGRVRVLADELDVSFARLLVSFLRAADFGQCVDCLLRDGLCGVFLYDASIPYRGRVRAGRVQEERRGELVPGNCAVGSHRRLLIRRLRDLRHIDGYLRADGILRSGSRDGNASLLRLGRVGVGIPEALLLDRGASAPVVDAGTVSPLTLERAPPLLHTRRIIVE